MFVKYPYKYKYKMNEKTLKNVMGVAVVLFIILTIIL